MQNTLLKLLQGGDCLAQVMSPSARQNQAALPHTVTAAGAKILQLKFLSWESSHLSAFL